MRTRFVVLSALVLSLISGSAIAAEAVSGKVEAFDLETRELVLESGDIFVLDEAVSVDNLDVGDEVMLSVETIDDQMVVTSMEISE
ncbi:DUF1344 domain-containing protein [Breoghania sp. L-A4]|uniref:DUF1344 domain-containing protein n=1 Tax=Breoghania sp. L-A4 TaxID=2304600 RepID=UPI0013C2A6AC|nr:DUF1344 domain-containing protein [Breoghania sp. L-A4]